MNTVVNAVVSVIILAAGVVCFRFFGTKPEIPLREDDGSENAAIVLVSEVKSYDDPLLVDVDGEASTYRVLTVSAEVAAQVVEKPDLIRSGSYVNAGDLLFRLDSRDFDFEVKRLEAQVEQTVEEIASLKIDVENTDELILLSEEDVALQAKQLQRYRGLYASGSATESSLDEKVKNELTARNSLQKLKNERRMFTQKHKTKLAELKVFQAQLDRSKLDVKRCEVRSPIRGRIVDDVVEQGDYLSAGAPLVHISDSSRMEIKCSLQAEQLAWIWRQELAKNPDYRQSERESGADPIQINPVKCEVVYEFEGIETIWDGFLTRFEGTGIDRETRMFPCRVVVNEPTNPRTNRSPGGRPGVTPPTLLSGMYVSVRIPIESGVPLLKLPLEGVRPGGELWVARDGKLSVMEVTIARVEDLDVIIRSDDNGVCAGDQVVISPLSTAKEGMAIKVQSDQPDESSPAEQTTVEQDDASDDSNVPASTTPETTSNESTVPTEEANVAGGVQ